MFASRYFNPRYWAGRYWPKIGGEIIDPTGHLKGVCSVSQPLSADCSVESTLSASCDTKTLNGAINVSN